MTRSAFVVTRLIRPELLFYESFAERPDQYEVVVQKDGKTSARTLPVLGRQPDGSPITGGFGNYRLNVRFRATSRRFECCG
jgi:hypothetical protein